MRVRVGVGDARGAALLACEIDWGRAPRNRANPQRPSTFREGRQHSNLFVQDLKTDSEHEMKRALKIYLESRDHEQTVGNRHNII